MVVRYRKLSTKYLEEDCMSVLQWHVRKIILLISWIVVCLGLLVFLWEHRIIAFIIGAIFCGVTNKKFYHCPHCDKLIDMGIFVTEETRCVRCGRRLTQDPYNVKEDK